jgi:DegV family protein with EDD domain
MSKIAIVTDSTCSMPPALVQKYGINVLPQVLIWGPETYRDGVDIQPAEFYTRLATAKVMPSTSQVTPAGFKNIYDQLLQEGYEILTVLISQRLSGTVNSAEQAKAMLPGAKIEIVDSYSTAMAMGFVVIEAAKAVQAGASLADARALVERKMNDTGVILTPDTLEFLHRGGRIGNATRFLGTALNIKPLLNLQDGIIEPLERVRTRRKALQRILELVAQRAAGRPVRLAALHANARPEAEELLNEAKGRLNVIEGLVHDVSPVIGANVGPGTVAITWMVEG